MAFWLPWAKDTVIFNDMRGGKFVSVVMNWKTKEERIIPYPISAVPEDGTWALGINYARLFLTRPDYGYFGNGQDPKQGVVFPEDDGLFRINLKTGEIRLIVPCAAVKGMVHLRDTFYPDMEEHKLYERLYREVYLGYYRTLRPLHRKLRELTGG